MDFNSLTNEALAAALTERRERATAIFAAVEADAQTVSQEMLTESETLVAEIGEIEAVQAARKSDLARFNAARATFSAEPVEPEAEAEPEAETTEPEAEPVVEAAKEDEKPEDDPEKDDKKPLSAAVSGNLAERVAAGAPKTPLKASPKIVITAAADIPGVPMGQHMNDISDVAVAMKARSRGFPQFNLAAAEQARATYGDAERLTKVPIASLGIDYAPEHRAGKTADEDYDAIKAAVQTHTDGLMGGMRAALQGKPLTAAPQGWCTPSQVLYNWIADYVIDGLISLPEIDGTRRGGVMLTEGPQLAQGTYANPDDFGFGGTEAQALAGYVKTCETIECPEWEDHRLDFVGYCWKFPILTEHAFPELIADALRLSDVLWAHKINRRHINDIIGMSDPVDATTDLGGVQMDTLEALTQVAVKERRWWNLGENAVMEVKLPQEAREIFKFDMARRSGLALNDIATDQKVAAHFANHNLAVEYLSDFDQRHGAATPTPDWPETIRAIIYPVGTFLAAGENILNLSAIYDSTALSGNEYTGVFFERSIKTIRRGYRSHVVTIPVCVAGMTGANAYYCENGSV